VAATLASSSLLASDLPPEITTAPECGATFLGSHCPGVLATLLPWSRGAEGQRSGTRRARTAAPVASAPGLRDPRSRRRHRRVFRERYPPGHPHRLGGALVRLYGHALC